MKRALLAAALTAATLALPIPSLADSIATAQPAATATVASDSVQVARTPIAAFTTEKSSRRPASEPPGYPLDANYVTQLVMQLNVGGNGGG